MSVLSDPRRFRRWAAGLSLIVAPLFYLAGVVVDPALRQGGDDTRGVYGMYPDQVSLSASLLHWSWILMLPGIVGMVHLIRTRGVVLGHIAGGIAFLGVVNFSALMFGDFVYSRLERTFGAVRGDMLANEIWSDPGAQFGFRLPGFIGLVGLFVLGLVLAYARQGPWWSPFAITIGWMGSPIFPIGTVVAGLLFIAGTGVIGLRMLRMSDEEWAGETLPQAASSGSPTGNLANTR
ncbi:hypothetical protein [Rhizohabitans arisaemae]|uniref:hypothetical protein n=1 Tax=Rhizohabitans arisaemae TaxID=2720610 RepID=UPI0024B19035|nr:hypothetical protein [Rhizohabitans arisaemae]